MNLRMGRRSAGLILFQAIASIAALGLLAPEAKAADTRTVFAYSGGGSFARIAPGTWVEKRGNGSKSNFSEVTRTGDYIELYDADREMKVRLYDDAGRWYSDQAQAWVKWPGSDGGWR